MPAMTRTLRLIDQPDTIISVGIFQPKKRELDWSCSFSIDWPDGKITREIYGIDAIQSLDLALRMIGADLYASDYHKSDRLVWLERGDGYGFPVPKIMRDDLIGSDREFF